ncbi:MAG: hypothetical protein ACRDJC_16525 [Thermomicrobiales bacterium]
MGKTRLALAIAGDVAAHFADGVLWVDLAPLADPALVPAAVAAALGLRTASDTPTGDVLIGALHPRQALLLLDNCEHLVDATADLVATLLARCPALQVLATSRAPLKTVGSYWPYAPVLYDYIHRAMPADNPQSLTPDEVYALCAYLLYLNGIVPEDAVMDAQTLPQVVMPNHAGFTSPDPRPDVFNPVAGAAVPVATPTS